MSQENTKITELEIKVNDLANKNERHENDFKEIKQSVDKLCQKLDKAADAMMVSNERVAVLAEKTDSARVDLVSIREEMNMVDTRLDLIEQQIAKHSNDVESIPKIKTDVESVKSDIKVMKPVTDNVSGFMWKMPALVFGWVTAAITVTGTIGYIFLKANS